MVGLCIAIVGSRFPGASLRLLVVFLLGGGAWIAWSRFMRRKEAAFPKADLLAATFEAMEEGVIALDREGILRFLNRAAERLTGWTQSEIAGKRFEEVYEECRTSAKESCAADLIAEALEKNAGGERPTTGYLRTKKGDRLAVLQKAAPIRSRTGASPGVLLVFKDGRLRQAAEQRWHSEQSVTRILAEAEDFRSSVGRLLQAIGGSFEWDAGYFWEAHAGLDGLVRTESWLPLTDPGAAITDSGVTIQRGEGAAGNAWAQEQTIWIEKTDADACPAGWGTAFAFPIYIDGATLGIMEFCAHERRSRDAGFIETMGAIGSQIGQFIERKRAETAMRASEAHYRTIAETASDAFLTIDHEGKILFTNQAAERIFGYSNQELIGQDIAVLVPDELSPLQPEALIESRPSEEQKIPRPSVEVRGRHKSGRQIPLEISVGEFVNNGRRVFTGIARDITERKRAENMLSQLAFIVESSNDAIIGMTLRGNIVSWNKGAEKLYGYPPKDVLGKSVSLLLPPEQADEQMALLGKVAQGENVKPFETVRRQKSGALVDVSLSVSPITNAAGKICGASAIARDISEHKRDEAELERQKAAAEAASRAKDQFLAVLSHELRTPLTPVLAGVESLEDEPQSSEGKQILAAMRRNIELEARLIDDLLDLTRVNRGTLQLNPGPVDVHAAISHAAQICEHDSESKKLQVNLRLNAGQFYVEADSARLHQVLWNLMQNAVKFTDKGGMINVVTSNPAPDEIVLTFQDSGIGIEASAMGRIFDPFEQGERSIQRRFGGLGLGLAITKALVEAHGGKLSASSKGKGQGATFTVSLKTTPQKVNEKKSGPAQGTSAGAKNRWKILLVEDHDDTREAIHRLLTRRGYSVVVAATMREGLVAGTREEFDFLISDIGLPDGSGHVLMKELRRISGVKGIALSGFGMDSDLERSENAGFSEHLTKPLNLEMLEAVMRKLSVNERAASFS